MQQSVFWNLSVGVGERIVLVGGNDARAKDCKWFWYTGLKGNAKKFNKPYDC